MLLGVVAVAGVGLAAVKPPRRKSKRSPYAPLPSPYGPPEPWELEAEAAAAADEDPDDPDEIPEDPVGSGSPEDHCIDREPLLGAGEEDTAYFCVAYPLEDPEYAPEERGAPMAPVPSTNQWPLATTHRRRLVTSYLSGGGWRGDSGRAFAVSRGSRKHAGVDLFADVGDAVVAPEDGVIFRVYPFTKGTWAMYLWTNDDRIINLGEVEKSSWREFDIRPGVHVQQGQPIARIGAQDDGGAHMLHVETYDVAGLSEDQVEKMIRGEHYRWFKGESRPSGLMDPTAYLVMAGTRSYRAEQSEAVKK